VGIEAKGGSQDVLFEGNIIRRARHRGIMLGGEGSGNIYMWPWDASRRSARHSRAHAQRAHRSPAGERLDVELHPRQGGRILDSSAGFSSRVGARRFGSSTRRRGKRRPAACGTTSNRGFHVHDGTHYVRAWALGLKAPRTFNVAHVHALEQLDVASPRQPIPAKPWAAEGTRFGIDSDRPGVALDPLRRPRRELRRPDALAPRTAGRVARAERAARAHRPLPQPPAR